MGRIVAEWCGHAVMRRSSEPHSLSTSASELSISIKAPILRYSCTKISGAYESALAAYKLTLRDLEQYVSPWVVVTITAFERGSLFRLLACAYFIAYNLVIRIYVSSIMRLAY